MSSAQTLPSRRSLLAAALGGVAAWAAAAAVKADRTRAAVGDPILAGQANSGGGQTTSLTSNSSTNHTLVVTQNGTSTAIRGTANSGVGGRFQTGGKNRWALVATNSASSIGFGGGLEATAHYGTAVKGTSANGEAAIWGQGTAGAGVLGNSTNWTGVYGSGHHGVYGASSTADGYALYAQGRARIQTYLDMPEQDEAPAVPPPNTGRIFIRDVGGKTQLAVRFPGGATVAIVTEP